MRVIGFIGEKETIIKRVYEDPDAEPAPVPESTPEEVPAKVPA